MASLSKNQEFYAEVYETARELGYSPVQAELAASQAVHESRNGNSGLAKNHNNLFGIKAGSSWRGPVANMKTQEEVKGRNVTIRDAFRAYPSRRDSIVDYFDRLKDRWPEAYKAKTFDEAIAGLRAGKPGGYATDSRYDAKIAKTALLSTPAKTIAERRVDNIFGANPVPASAPKPGIDGQRIGYNPIRDQYGDKAAIPQPGASARLASQLAQYQQSRGAMPQPRNVPVPQTAPRPSQTITPNKVNTIPLAPANFNQSRFDRAPNRPVDQSQRFAPMPASVDPARFAPGPSVAELANQYSQYQRGTVPAQAPARTASVDPARFGNTATPQPNMTPNDVRNSYHNGLAGRLNPPSFATGPTTLQSVRDAQANLATSNRRDQFVRDVLRTGVQVDLAPPSVNVDRGRFSPGPSKAELANQYSQYGNRSISAPQNSSMYDMVDIPQSSTIAQQYASYGAGKIAPQVASSATQAAPVAPAQRQAAPTTVAPRSPTVAPSLASPQAINDAAKQRMDAAIPGIYQGIPKQDIYDQSAPGRSGFRGFGAGGFLGNLLTGNFGNMAGIERGGTLPGILGVIQTAVQGLGGPQQAAQAVQGAIPALGQVMGLPAAQQAARAGNNMVIGRDAGGRIGWMADGGLSAGALGAGWASNNPERNYGGYGGGYDPTPV